MNKRIVLLLSDLRGISGLINQFKVSFPDFLINPILFTERNVDVNSSPECLTISCDSVKQFAKNYTFSGVEAIFVSFMTAEKVLFIKCAPKNVKVIWSIPGGDLYNRYLRYFGYPICYGENKNIKYCIGKFLRKIPRRIEFNYLIDRCSAVVGAICDYKLIKEYASTHAQLPKHIYAIAYPMSKMLGPLYGKPFVDNSACKIIVGNSASRTNNHLYVLEFLKPILNKNVPVSLLMSYGDSDAKYRSNVISKYRDSLGDSVTFLTDFVPLDEFNQRLLSVTHFIYGNWRQEAVGNILTAFYLGGKVYLSKNNPLLEDFMSKGFSVFCLEDTDETFLAPLSIKDKEKNRQLVDSLYSEERCASLFETGLSLIINSHCHCE